MKLSAIKKILLIVCLLSTHTGYSQNFNVQSAADSYKNLRETKNRLKELTDAKKYIDLAAANEQTANDPKMWIYRGKIYLEIDQDTTEAVKSLDPDAIEKSAISFINCMKTDTKNNFTDECKSKIWVAGARINNKAIAALNKADYDKATRYFSIALEIIPFDKDNNLKRNTSITADLITYNLSKTAIRAKDYSKAKGYLQKLIDIKYNDPMLYVNMSRVYLEEKDTTKALSYVEQGRKIFEENTSLLAEEIKIYSAQGRFDVLIDKFTEAINIDPDKEFLYYNRASLYQVIKNNEKAESDYKKAIDLKSEYFEANYYLGVLYFNQGADLANSAKNIKNNDEFETAKKKYDEKFKQAEPYLEKALDINPKKTEEDQRLYKANLNSLKQLYARTGEMDKYNKIKGLQEQR